MSRSVLIICTGNICRSPYAEAKLKQLLPQIKIASAGLATEVSRLQNKPADRLAIKIAEEFDVDLSTHKANQITQELVEEYDIILAMEPGQIEILCDYFPSAEYKTFLFGHWINVKCIDDPYRQGRHAFLYAFTTINKAVYGWVEKLT